MKENAFRLDIRGKLSPVRVGKPSHWLPSTVVDDPFVEVFKARLDRDLFEQPGLIEGVPAHNQESWSQVIFKIPLNQTILFFYNSNNSFVFQIYSKYGFFRVYFCVDDLKKFRKLTKYSTFAADKVFNYILTSLFFFSQNFYVVKEILIFLPIKSGSF